MGIHPAALAAAAILVVLSLAAGWQRHPVRTALTAALAGAGALSAVNLLAPLTGVELAMNALTSFAAVVLGAPGVVLLLMLNLLFGIG